MIVRARINQTIQLVYFLRKSGPEMTGMGAGFRENEIALSMMPNSTRVFNEESMIRLEEKSYLRGDGDRKPGFVLEKFTVTRLDGDLSHMISRKKKNKTPLPIADFYTESLGDYIEFLTSQTNTCFVSRVQETKWFLPVFFAKRVKFLKVFTGEMQKMTLSSRVELLGVDKATGKISFAFFLKRFPFKKILIEAKADGNDIRVYSPNVLTYLAPEEIKEIPYEVMEKMDALDYWINSMKMGDASSSEPQPFEFKDFFNKFAIWNPVNISKLPERKN